MPNQPAIRVIRRSGGIRDCSPDAEQHRLLLELRDGRTLDEGALKAYLRQLAHLCSLRLVSEPFVTALEPSGLAGWIHADEGGAQLQTWGDPLRLATLSLVSSGPLDAEQVLRFSALSFAAREAVASDPLSPGEHWKTTAERAQLRELCEWAIGEARSGKDLARATTLVVGAGLAEELAGELLARIAEGVRALHASTDPKLALTHGEGLGEALLLLRHAGVEIAEDLRPGRAEPATGVEK